MEFGILRSEDRIAGFSGWERKLGYGHEVQTRKNYRQSGYKKVWDTVLGDYGKGSIGLRICCDGLLYAFAINGDY
jgi:hypothetical protein